ncbi:MAG: hypothetical protein R3327_00550, partial [Nitrosopumilaceae archaeon]|nr:hypothetical protein [Nitrosopumilaceae archaeon]
MKTLLSFLAFLVILLGFSFTNASAEILPNSAFVLEGSGYGVTEEMIRVSDIDLAILTNSQSRATTNFTIEDGFVSLADTEFLVNDLKGSFLREGQFIRINGSVEDSSGETVTVRFFGRLIEESKDASIYGFTGRLNTVDESFKIIYTSKLSKLTTTPVIPIETEEKQLTVYILKGSSTQGLASSYIESSATRLEATITQGTDGALRASYFSHDRITVEPGTTITITNKDLVSHRIVSGQGLGTHSSVISGAVKICSEDNLKNIPKGFSIIPAGSDARGCDFTFDGRINTGVIPPEGSVSVTFKERG